MPYLIDGHNLIPKIPGLRLENIDDETQLIELLQAFCRLRRKEVEVYFDNASPGQPRGRAYGQVVARFVRQGTTADEAISARLSRLGRSARNWTVVSSDQAVQAAARAARAQFLSSEAFAAQLVHVLDESGSNPEKRTDVALDEGEIDEWLDLFKDDD